MPKPHARTRRLAPSLVLALSLALSGCTAGTPADPVFNRDREGAVEVPVASPESFVTKAEWSVPHAPDASVALGAPGIVTFEAGAQGEYRPVALNPRDGSRVWAAYDVLASKAAPPSLHLVESGGQQWVVALTYEGKDVTVSTYNPMLTGDVTPVHTRRFTPESKTAPRVVAHSDGVLVVGAKDASVAQYHAESDSMTVLTDLPKKDDKAPTPVESFRDGVLLAYGDGGFVYFAKQGAWKSAKVAPEGADASKGKVIASNGGVTVVEWPLRGGGTGLWLHETLTGRVVAGGKVDDVQKIAQARQNGAPLVESADGEAILWGEFLFDPAAEGVRTLDLHGGQARAARAGVVYASGAASALVEPADGFDGSVAFDWEKGEPVKTSGSIPVGFSYLGHGVFSEGDAVYAVNLG